MKILLKIFFPFFLAVIFLICSESALRIFDYGYNTSYIIQKQTPTGPKAVLNPEALCSYTSLGVLNSYTEPFVNIPLEKSANSIRVIVLGGSAAYGAYLTPDFSFTRYLEAMLAQRFPEYTIDVVNLNFPSLNSSTMARVLKDAVALKPDFVICYEAFNDLGRGVAMQVVPIPPKAVFLVEQMAYALKRLKIYQLAVNYAGKYVPRMMEYFITDAYDDFQSSNSMTPAAAYASITANFADKYIRRILAYFVSDSYDNFQSFHSMTSAATHAFIAAFKYNMEKIVSICQEQHIPVFLCTYAYNMKNLTRFVPLSGKTNLEGIEAHLSLLRQAYDFECAGDYWAAIFFYERFHDLFPNFPDPLCHIAFCYHALGMPEQAAKRYERARLLADGSLEKIEALNQVVRDMAALSSEDDIVLVDIADALKKASPLGFMPGEEFFSDMVHFTLKGSYTVAANLYQSIIMYISKDAFALPPAQAECEMRLGVTLLREKEIITAKKLPFGTMSRLYGSYAIMQEVITDHQLSQAEKFMPADRHEQINILMDNCKSNRADYYCYKNQIIELSKAGKPEMGLRVAEQLVEATDRHSLALVLYGQILLQNNQPELALKVLKEAMEQPSRALDLHLRLSCAEMTLYLGRPQEAENILVTGLRIIENREPFMVSFDRKIFALFKKRYLSAWQRTQQHLAEMTSKQ